MRENRTYGSEGGAAIGRSDPIKSPKPVAFPVPRAPCPVIPLPRQGDVLILAGHPGKALLAPVGLGLFDALRPG